MYRNKLSLLTIAALVAVTGSASAATIKKYAKFGASFNNAHVKDKNQDVLVDNVLGLNIGYGLSFGNGLRLDLEYTENFPAKKAEKDSTEIEKMEFSTKTLMLNGYHEYVTGTKLNPYTTFGIGESRAKIFAKEIDYYANTVNVFKKVHSGFAYQAGLGIAYSISDKISIDTGYRYVKYGNLKNKKADINLKSHSNVFLVSGRYSF